jgi:hypothetical protein
VSERLRVLVTDEVDPEGVAILRADPRIEVVEPSLRMVRTISRFGILHPKVAHEVGV